MRINIAASHRFHLLDLARELEKLGHDVRFYSYVPTKRAIKFGLKKENSYSLYYLMIPFLSLERITKNSFWATKFKFLALDYFLCCFMKPCDVYIALGTVYLQSFKVAKRKFNALTILEWGSKHIKEQKKILSRVIELQQPEYFINRSMKGYEIVDKIAIPSDHVKQSFIKWGVCEAKILQNPYGVDLSMFKPLKNIRKEYDLIMVGGWSYRKGCDLLIELCKNSEYSLLHVGSIVDLDFPKMNNMTHINSVEQSQLIHYYSKAKVFVLPSREEGLALVQAQALACGLPVVCSEHTGGRDLKEFIANKEYIIEMKEYTHEELLDSIYFAVNLITNEKTEPNNSINFNKLSWFTYGASYDNNLINSLNCHDKY